MTIESSRPVIPLPRGGASPAMIQCLQAGRAVAALMVVLYHAAFTVEHLRLGLPPVLVVPLSYGYLGVDFFFVLSGFIIYYTNRHETPDRAWLKRYATSRLVRIYIPYLPVGIALGLAYTLLPGLSASGREWGWLSTLTLFPTDAEPSLLVAWTLQHELLFYLIFWMSFRLGVPVLGVALWAAAAAIWTLAGGDLSFPTAYFLSIINAEFLFGMVAVHLVATRVSSPLLLAGSLGALTAYILAGADPDDRVLFALAVALALVPLVRADLEGRVAISAFGRLLGDASYAIYLVHLPLIALLSRFAPAHWAPALLLFAFAGAAGGLAYYFIYERPLLKLVRSWLRARRERHGPAAVAMGGEA